jgi:hypothetical protein
MLAVRGAAYPNETTVSGTPACSDADTLLALLTAAVASSAAMTGLAGGVPPTRSHCDVFRWCVETTPFLTNAATKVRPWRAAI